MKLLGWPIFFSSRLIATPTAPLPVDSSSSPAVVARHRHRALAALRCFPCLVGSFATTQDARREAVSRPLGLIEDLLAAACSTPSSDATVAAKKRPSSAIQKSVVDKPAGGCSESEPWRKRGKGKGKGKGGKATSAVEGAHDGGGEEGVGGGEPEDEVAVLRAHALEAAVGLCALLPPDDESESESGVAGREETLGRLLRWHER